MKKKGRLCSGVIALGCMALLLTLRAAEQQLPGPPFPGWKPGDSWRVAIEKYSINWAAAFGNPEQEAKKNVPKVSTTYTVAITLLGKESVAEQTCWKIEFLALPDAPEMLRGTKCHVFLGESLGQIVRVDKVGGLKEFPSVEIVNGIALLPHPPFGFPIEFVPQTAVAESKPAGKRNYRRATMKRTLQQGETMAEASLEHEFSGRGWQPERSVRQTWNPQAGWWTTYETRQKGHLDIRARLLPASEKGTNGKPSP